MAKAKTEKSELWENRMEITGSSGNIYVVSQHKTGRYWGCSCPGWKSRKRCKHLETMGLPPNCEPFELKKGNDFTSGYKKAPKAGSPADWEDALNKIRPTEKIPEKVKLQFEFGDEEETTKS